MKKNTVQLKKHYMVGKLRFEYLRSYKYLEILNSLDEEEETKWSII